MILLAVALCALPIIPHNSFKPQAGADPVTDILVTLLTCVGLPYFVLSTTSPLLQAWFGLSRPGYSPYRLYALSNAGSLIALVSYPFIVEPALSLRTQAVIWSVGFVVFTLLCVWCTLAMYKHPASGRPLETASPKTSRAKTTSPSPAAAFFWVAFPATSSTLLLAVTNQMCWDVAVVPFLWILPLTLYLLSFIICFEYERAYYRPAFWILLTGATVGIICLTHMGSAIPIWKQIAGYSGALFIFCLVCHGELVKLKPPTRYLTRFYLLTALGGALGGIFVALIAPHIFHAYRELQLGIWICCALAIAAPFVRKNGFSQSRNTPGRKSLTLLAYTLPLIALAVVLIVKSGKTFESDPYLLRNFYGVLNVNLYRTGDPKYLHLTLENGRICHGLQFQLFEKRNQPTTYYTKKSGIGLALSYPWPHPLRVGVIGLGVGTVAAYGRPGDTYRFYEINPAVESLSGRNPNSMFTYLKDSPAECQVVLGDARLSLEYEEPQQFNVLALDAFTGDAIPIHLLTREAFQQYRRHLQPGGILAVHITNSYLDLEPVVRAIAENSGLPVIVVYHKPSYQENQEWDLPSKWLLITDNKQFLENEQIRAAANNETDTGNRYLWTDDYSNLFQTLKFRTKN
ncbi:MAG: fused MFS/spermidine synthase [Candidatus Omnitrophica bacterium]|nr:fused MFS/spermidine synthase [Candidatus Omnitrophota bacterium]